MTVRIFDATLESYITSLEKPAIAKVVRTIELLELFGPKLGMPHTRKIGNIHELRIHGKQEVRILYAFWKGDIVLLHGFTKKSQKIPRKELSTALQKFHILTRQ